MRYSCGITAAFLLSCAVSLPAWADSALASEPELARVSTSMSDVLPSDPLSAEELDQLASRLNQNLSQANAPAPSALDSLDLPFIADLIDDEGNLSLPLGITVFNTMGDTSVGFSSKF